MLPQGFQKEPRLPAPWFRLSASRTARPFTAIVWSPQDTVPASSSPRKHAPCPGPPPGTLSARHSGCPAALLDSSSSHRKPRCSPLPPKKTLSHPISSGFLGALHSEGHQHRFSHLELLIGHRGASCSVPLANEGP